MTINVPELQLVVPEFSTSQLVVLILGLWYGPTYVVAKMSKFETQEYDGLNFPPSVVRLTWWVSSPFILTFMVLKHTLCFMYCLLLCSKKDVIKTIKSNQNNEVHCG